MSDKVEQKDHTARDLDTLILIGSFLAVFGVAVMIAVFYTDTFHGKIVNLISGGLIFLIGLAGVIKGRWNRKKG
ncbi:MAG: hypothetical protein GXO75_01310 [Calditrichaeota bacterium]|nr:hypothetical protein [Calditrichota bacterium]